MGGAWGGRAQYIGVVVRRFRCITMQWLTQRQGKCHAHICHTSRKRPRSQGEELIRRFIDEALVGEIFVPRFETMRRWKGEWHKRTERLAPGYLFVETHDAEKLALQLRRVPAFTKVLGNNEVFIPLNDEEVAWLNAFTGNDRRVIEMSEGIVEGDKVIVLRGPLRGHEAEIKRIDRHRRMAELEVSMLGRMKTIRLGLEIISKSPAKA